MDDLVNVGKVALIFSLSSDSDRWAGYITRDV